MNGKILNKTQAHKMAIGLLPFISSYVKSHREAYIEYLKANNLVDEQYYKPDKEWRNWKNKIS